MSLNQTLQEAQLKNKNLRQSLQKYHHQKTNNQDNFEKLASLFIKPMIYVPKIKNNSENMEISFCANYQTFQQKILPQIAQLNYYAPSFLIKKNTATNLPCPLNFTLTLKSI